MNMIENIKKKKYWVARDKNNTLYVYLQEPKRDSNVFRGGACRVITGDDKFIFNFVTWENSPWQISTD